MKYSWLSGTKFYQQGGRLEQAMQQLTPILEGATKELQSGKVGQNIQQLLSIASDAEGSDLLQQLASSNPQIEEIIQAALKLAQQEEEIAMQEKGGCITCPKHKVLMRQGGRLVEILVDCHDRPVYAKKGCKVKKECKAKKGCKIKKSCKAKKGCKIKKGQIGIAGGLNKKYTGGPKVGVIGANEQIPTSPNIYYDSASNKWMQQNYIDGQGWGNASELSMADKTADLKQMTDGQVYTYWDPTKGQLMTRTYNAAQKGWTAPTAISDIYQQGFRYTGDGRGVFDTQANAVAALGQDTFDSYYDSDSKLKRWGSLTGTRGNLAIGSTSSDISARQAVDTLGFKGALREARDINAAKRRVDWNNRQAALRNTYGIDFDATRVGKGTATVNGKQYFKDENGNWYDKDNNALAAGTEVNEDMYGSNRELRKAIRAQYTTNKKARRSEYSADSAAIISNYLNNNRKAITGTAGTAGKLIGGKKATTPISGTTTNTVLKKNGGWLNKYTD